MNNPKTGERMKYVIWNDYRVYKDGRIYSIKQQKFISERQTDKGYMIVWVKVNNQWITMGVHRIVALAWLGDYSDLGYEVDHINNCRHDNRLINLQWLSKSANNQKTWDSGNKDNSGTNNGRAIACEHWVHEICLLLEEGCSPSYIRDITGYPYHTLIRPIKAHRTWCHISKDYIF
jgi:hypothetical protein